MKPSTIVLFIQENVNARFHQAIKCEAFIEAIEKTLWFRDKK
jgi:hypothetical protein